MTRPSSIPANYVEQEPGVWCHPSRMVGGVATRQPEPNGGEALDREASAAKGGGKRVARGSVRKSRGDRKAQGVRAALPRIRIHLAARFQRGALFDQHDNLRAAMKPLVDAIAESFGAQDDDPRFAWEYSQAETSGRNGVVVTMEESETN